MKMRRLETLGVLIWTSVDEPPSGSNLFLPFHFLESIKSIMVGTPPSTPPIPSAVEYRGICGIRTLTTGSKQQTAS